MIELLDEPEVADEVIDRAEITDGKPLVQYTRTEAALADLKARFKGAAFDCATTAGDKAARAARLELVTLRTTLEKTRKSFKEPALEFGRLIDAEAKRIATEIVALEDPIDRQIKADETRRAEEKAERERVEAARIASHQQGIDKILGYVSAAADLPAERIGAGVAKLDGWLEAFDPATWEEFADRAKAALVDTRAALAALQAKAQAREDEAASVEAQRIENARVAAELAAERTRIEQAARQIEDDRRAAAAMAAPQPTPPAAPATDCAGQAPEPETTGPRGIAVSKPEPAHSAPTLKLGDICERLGFLVNESFLCGLGLGRATLIKQAKLYQESDWPKIKRALIEHIEWLP